MPFSSITLHPPYLYIYVASSDPTYVKERLEERLASFYISSNHFNPVTTNTTAWFRESPTRITLSAFIIHNQEVVGKDYRNLLSRARRYTSAWDCKHPLVEQSTGNRQRPTTAHPDSPSPSLTRHDAYPEPVRFPRPPSLSSHG